MTNLSGGAHFDLSASGTLAYVTGVAAEAERELAWVDLDGHVEPLSNITIPGRVYHLSADGTQVARQNPGDSTGGIYSQDLVRGTRRRLSESPEDFAPIWTRDGQYIVYTRGVRHSAILRKPVNGGAEETILTSNQLLRTEAVSPDGRTVLYVSFDPVTGADIWATPIDHASGARPFVKTKFTESFPEVSPDNRWVAYQSNASGRFEIYARAFPGGEPTIQLTTDGAFAPEWAPDGRQIYYYSADAHMMALAVDSSAADLRPGRARVLFDAKGFENELQVSPDGKRLLMMPLMKSENEATQIQLVTNFLSDLKQRVR